MPGLYDKMMQKSMEESQQPPSPIPATSSTQPQQPEEPKENQKSGEQIQISSLTEKKEKPVGDTTIPRYQDTLTPRYHDTTVPSNHDTVIPDQETDSIETVRKAVKHLGKEPATQRLTSEEKKTLADIEYIYRRKDIKTSGNEIIRIALNYIIHDYREKKEQSILAQVLEKLNS